MAPKKSEIEQARKKLAQHFSSANQDRTKSIIGKGATFKKYETMALFGSTSLTRINDAITRLETNVTPSAQRKAKTQANKQIGKKMRKQKQQKTNYNVTVYYKRTIDEKTFS